MLSRLCGYIIGCLLMCASAAHAFTCAGPLKDSQAEGFKALFSPKFSPSLSHKGGAVAPENMAKRLTQQELSSLAKNTPVVAASAILNDSNANTLKGWLNDNAGDAVPGWFTTVLGVSAPAAWVGLAADVAVQLINGAGDAGRIQLANIAGTVSEGGIVGVTHRVAKGSDGSTEYIWNYTYSAQLNNKNVIFMLYSCTAAVEKI